MAAANIREPGWLNVVSAALLKISRRQGDDLLHGNARPVRFGAVLGRAVEFAILAKQGAGWPRHLYVGDDWIHRVWRPRPERSIGKKKEKFIPFGAAAFADIGKQIPPPVMLDEGCINRCNVLQENAFQRPLMGEIERTIEFYYAFTGAFRDHVMLALPLKNKRIGEV